MDLNKEEVEALRTFFQAETNACNKLLEELRLCEKEELVLKVEFYLKELANNLSYLNNRYMEGKHGNSN